MKLFNKINNIKKSGDSRTLIANFGYLTLLQVAGYIFPLITIPYLAKVIGVDSFGKITFASAIIVWFQTITDWGFNYTATRDVAKNRQKGYVYFQEFIPNNGFDTRVEIVGDKAIGLIRYTRENDFRASGSHNNKYDAELIPEGAIDFAFYVAEKLGIQAVALDLVQHKETKEFYLIETSYCYGVDDDEFDHGYWAKGAKLHKEEFNGIHWMIEHVIENYKKKEKSNKEAILLQHK